MRSEMAEFVGVGPDKVGPSNPAMVGTGCSASYWIEVKACGLSTLVRSPAGSPR